MFTNLLIATAASYSCQWETTTRCHITGGSKAVPYQKKMDMKKHNRKSATCSPMTAPSAGTPHCSPPNKNKLRATRASQVGCWTSPKQITVDLAQAPHGLIRHAMLGLWPRTNRSARYDTTRIVTCRARFYPDTARPATEEEEAAGHVGGRARRWRWPSSSLSCSDWPNMTRKVGMSCLDQHPVYWPARY